MDPFTFENLEYLCLFPPMVSAPTKVPTSKVLFEFDDIITAVLSRCDIPELKQLSLLNHEWKNLADSNYQWHQVSKDLDSTSLKSKEQVKKYFNDNKQIPSFDKLNPNLLLRQRLDQLFGSERIDEINKRQVVVKARDTLIVWQSLQNEIGGPGCPNLDVANFNSISDVLELASQFQGWCIDHQHLLSKIEDLDLYENQLTSLPAEIRYLTGLRELKLDKNQLTSLPPEIGNLAMLRKLDLYENQLKSLPKEIGNLASLQELYLSKNQLTSLPKEIGKLAELRHLFLGDNQVLSLPTEIGNLKRLQTLSLMNNQLTSVPEEICNLTTLQKLFLSENQLTSLPVEIGNCAELRELNLWDNQLTSLPAEIGNCAELRKLNLWNNQLASLPAEIGNCAELQELNLWDNPLKSLPKELRNLAALNKFECDTSLQISFAVQRLWWSTLGRCFDEQENI